MSWTPQRHEDYDALKGFDVYSSDDEKLGTIREVYHPRDEMPAARGRHFFRVEPGMIEGLFTDVDEVFVPEPLIRAIDPKEDRVILEVPKSQLTDHDFGRPAGLDTYRRT